MACDPISRVDVTPAESSSTDSLLCRMNYVCLRTELTSVNVMFSQTVSAVSAACK